MSDQSVGVGFALGCARLVRGLRCWQIFVVVTKPDMIVEPFPEFACDTKFVPALLLSLCVDILVSIRLEPGNGFNWVFPGPTYSCSAIVASLSACLATRINQHHGKDINSIFQLQHLGYS